jgi:hypothetical protein
MPSGVDFSEIQAMADEFTGAVGKDREGAKRLLLLYAGVDRLKDLTEVQARDVEGYMRSVIKLHRERNK